MSVLGSGMLTSSGCGANPFCYLPGPRKLLKSSLAIRLRLSIRMLLVGVLSLPRSVYGFLLACE